MSHASTGRGPTNQNRPAGTGFAALAATTALLFNLWHTWHYDRFKWASPRSSNSNSVDSIRKWCLRTLLTTDSCLLYSRQNWFRALMCQILLTSIICFVIADWIGLHVFYSEVFLIHPYSRSH